MKKTLTLLVASTALSAAIGVPAWSAMQAPANGSHSLVDALFADGPQAMPLVLASGDDDDHSWKKSARRGDDDEGDDHDGEDDHEDGHGHDDDDDDDGGRADNPAPAGTVAPPQNGLFNPGAAPKVQVN